MVCVLLCGSVCVVVWCVCEVCVDVCMYEGTLRVMGVFHLPSGFYQVSTVAKHRIIFSFLFDSLVCQHLANRTLAS